MATARAHPPSALLVLLAFCSGCGPGLILRGGRVNGAAVESLRRTVSVNRGLAFTRPVPVTVQSTQELSDFVGREVPPGEGDRAAERVLLRLGLFASATDSASQTEEWLRRAGGLYSSSSGTVVLQRDRVRELPPFYQWLPGVIDPVASTLAHELTHALQDQHWPQGPALPVFSDGMLAQRALREGDAMLSAATGLRLQGRVSEEGTDEAKLLPALRRFLYRDGHAFVVRTFAAGGWRAVDALYDGPLSTKRILHPERAAEAPIEVKLGAPRALEQAGWSRVREAPMGELLIRQLARRVFPAERAGAIAGGWRGDTLRALSRDDELELVWMSSWESPADAAEFAQALPQLVPGAFVERRERDVLALIGPVSPQADLATACWVSSGRGPAE